MNKKLILNKVTIAQLTNPDRVFGGEGGPGDVPPTIGGSPSCNGTVCATCPGYDTCDSPEMACQLVSAVEGLNTCE